MNCAECKNNHGGDGREAASMRGYEIHVPCISTRLSTRRQISEDGKCTAFAQKTTPVDPTLTQDSVCGECAVLISGHCKTKLAKRNAGATACCKFQGKPNDKPEEPATVTALPIGHRATCRHCDDAIKWQGEHWVHMSSSPRHPAQPKETKL